MTRSRYTFIEQKIDSFPTLPSTAAQVIELTARNDTSAQDLVEVITPDQSMCVAILRIANSALYGLPKKVSSLERAIMVLGFKEVMSIAVSKAVVNSFGKLINTDKEAIDHFWDHSFTCGLAAKNIAEHLGQSSGQFFMGGLIHDIGKLAMLLAFPDEYSTKEWLEGFSTPAKLAREQQMFSITHDKVGGLLLQKWSFPESLLVALAYHHSPMTSPKFDKYALVIQLADVLAFLCCNQDLVEDDALIPAILRYLPDIDSRWKDNHLPWNEVIIDGWFAWLKIDREHGGSIMSILSTT